MAPTMSALESARKSFPGRLVGRYGRANGGTWAQVIAWNGVTAFLPLTLVAVGLLGLLLGNHGIAASVEGRVAGAVGNGADKQAVLDALETFRQRSGIFAVVGLVSLMWSGSSLIGAFDQAFNSLYVCKPRAFIAEKVMAVGVMALFTIAAIPLVASSAVLPLLKNIPNLPSFVYQGAGAFILQVGLGIVDASVLFAVVYFVVPNRRQKWRDILPGALAAGILLEIVTLLWPLYFQISNGFATYGKSFSLLFLLLAYFYLLGQIVVVGACVNSEMAGDPDPAVSREPSSTSKSVAA